MFIVRNPGVFDECHEMGMGFHFARATSGDIRGSIGVILNGTFALNADDLRSMHQSEGLSLAKSLEKFKDYLEKPSVNFEPVNDVDVYFDFLLKIGYRPPEILKRQYASMHSSPSRIGFCRSGDCFVRFSAFRNDRRVGQDGTLLAGSYCTSESDTSCVPNALSAVGRYALPNTAPPVHVFRIFPPQSTPMNYGTVVPNFGQAGGGAEMEFNQQLPPGSVVYAGTIAEW